jgi:hypothetical protein
MIYGDVANVLDFGAIGDGITNDAVAIQAAIDFVSNNNGGVLVFPSLTYKVNAKILHRVGVVIDFQGSLLDFSSCADDYAWETTGSLATPRGAGITLRPYISNGFFKGVVTPSSGVFNATLGGLKFDAPALIITNMSLSGFKKAINFESFAYLIQFNDCSFSYNEIAWNADKTGFIDSGAQLGAYACSFAQNDYDINIDTMESIFTQCSYDSQRIGCVKDNISGSGGANASMLTFNSCRFERLGIVGTAGTAAFVNNGIMVLNSCVFYEPLNTDYLFENNGVIQMDGGLLRIEQGPNFYLADMSASATITIGNVFAANYGFQCVFMHPTVSSVYNGDFELGNTNGFIVTTGTAGDVTVTSDSHIGDFALQLLCTGASLTVQSFSVAIPTPSNRMLLNLFYKNANSSSDASVTIQFFNSSDVEIDSAFAFIPASISTYTQLGIPSQVPNGAIYAKIQIFVPAALTLAIKIDDFYVNFV